MNSTPGRPPRQARFRPWVRATWGTIKQNAHLLLLASGLLWFPQVLLHVFGLAQRTAKWNTSPFLKLGDAEAVLWIEKWFVDNHGTIVGWGLAVGGLMTVIGIGLLVGIRESRIRGN